MCEGITERTGTFSKAFCYNEHQTGKKTGDRRSSESRGEIDRVQWLACWEKRWRYRSQSICTFLAHSGALRTVTTVGTPNPLKESII
eukprot:1179483-Prorocentrum_minimum.AAC.3